MGAKNHQRQNRPVKAPLKYHTDTKIKVLQEKGFMAYQQGRFDEAERYYRETITLNRKDTDGHNGLGITLIAQGKVKEAIKYLRKAIKLFPQNASACLNLGVALRRQNSLDEATKWHKRAVELHPENPHVHSYLGKCFSDCGEWDKAILCFEKTLTLAPEDTRSLGALGSAFRQQGNWKAAQSYFQRLLALQPNDAATHSNLGVVLKNLEKTSEAIFHFRRALDLDANNVLARHELAAATGETTETTPGEYVRQLFDQYASTFEQHLIEDLDYRAPQLICQYLSQVTGEAKFFENVLDLGCGTGLCGTLIKGHSKRLSGVDIAPIMVEKAKEKNIYDILKAADLTVFMKGAEEKYDLFIAADVFVYIGNLKPIFDAIKQCASKGAYIVFSVEHTETANYLLQYSGRYAHHSAYIQSLSEEQKFCIELSDSVHLRKEKNDWVKGYIYVLSYLKDE